MSVENEKNRDGVEEAGLPVEDCTASTCEGTIVSVEGRKLVMKNLDGKKHAHALAKGAKLTQDGTACKVEDLRAGSKIRVTTVRKDRDVVTAIEVLDQQTNNSSHGSRPPAL